MGNVVVHATSHRETWDGPLPSPRTMSEYRDISPDWPERIVKQWEEESAHRREFEMHSLKCATRRELIGQLLAGAFALSALGVAAYAVACKEPWVAGTIGGVTLASVVAAFLYQQRAKKDA